MIHVTLLLSEILFELRIFQTKQTSDSPNFQTRSNAQAFTTAAKRFLMTMASKSWLHGANRNDESANVDAPTWLCLCSEQVEQRLNKQRTMDEQWTLYQHWIRCNSAMFSMSWIAWIHFLFRHYYEYTQFPFTGQTDAL